MARQKAKPMQQWSVPIKITLNCIATVDASDATEAITKAERGEFLNDGRDCGDPIDWKVNGKAEPVATNE